MPSPQLGGAQSGVQGDAYGIGEAASLVDEPFVAKIGELFPESDLVDGVWWDGIRHQDILDRLAAPPADYGENIE